MDDALAVSRLESRRDARGAAQGFAQRQWASEKALLQRFALDQLENQERRLLPFDDVEERADVWMIHLRDEPGLAFEACATVVVRGKLGWKHLDGDFTSKARVVRPIHLAHRAATQKGDDFVGPKAVARRQRHCCG